MYLSEVLSEVLEVLVCVVGVKEGCQICFVLVPYRYSVVLLDRVLFHRVTLTRCGERRPCFNRRYGCKFQPDDMIDS